MDLGDSGTLGRGRADHRVEGDKWVERLDYWCEEEGQVGCVCIGVGRKSSLDKTKTDPGVGTRDSKLGESWMVVGDMHGKSKGNYDGRVSWESNVAGWMGKDTGWRSSPVVVVDSSGALRGQRYDGGHQGGQRWIRRQ